MKWIAKVREDLKDAGITDSDMHDRRIFRQKLHERKVGLEVKNIVSQFLKEMGLRDPDSILPAHLKNWYKEVAHKESDFEKMCALVTSWLLHWMQTLAYHVNLVISQIQDGELTTEIDSAALHRLESILDTSLQLEAHDEPIPPIDGDGSPPPDDIAGEMIDVQPREQVRLHDTSHKKKLLPTIVPHLNDPHIGIPLVLKGAIRRRIVDIDLERNITEMTVVLKPGLKLLPHGHVRPMEALNYFCELQSRMKQINMRHLDACLSDIHIAPEDKASPSMKAHLPWKSHLHRPMSTVFPNPFNTRTAYPGPVLLTLKTSYKYFCPNAAVPKSSE
ncbi:uncharacterized protein [Anabrus simplex]|uniref:uncharacterized protein n=1 Tax=Anabrus simplex TaxID=316456 RepID=UPI0035A3582E